MSEIERKSMGIESQSDEMSADAIIRLDRTDDIDTIVERLHWVTGRHAIVIVPGSSEMLANLVSLRLLARAAEDLQLTVLLVARDSLTRRLAREASLRAYLTEWEARWALRRLQKRSGKFGAPAIELGPTPNRPAQSATGKKKRRKRPGDELRLWTLPSGRRLMSLLVGMLTLVALGAGLAYTVIMLVPLATVTVTPAISRVSETVMVTADLEVTEVDVDSRMIPARVVEVRVEGSAQVPTTGKRPAPSQHATGKIIFSNRTAQEVEVPAGTIVRTSTGSNIRFTTTQKVTVPAGVGSRAEVEIKAVLPGPTGNVGAFLITTIEGGLSLLVTAVNDQPTTNGDVQEVNVVTAIDKDRVKIALLQQLRQEAYIRLQEQLDEQEFVAPESVQVFIISELYDKFLDEISDTLGLKMRIVANGVAVAGQDANRVALAALEKMVPAGYELVAPGLTFERGEIRLGEKRRLTFPMTASGTVVARLDTSGLRETLQGQPIARAEAIVMERFPLKKPPTIEVRPNWFDRMPALPFRINVVKFIELD